MQKGDDQYIVGNFYVNIPQKDTNMVINFTPGKNAKYFYIKIKKLRK